ncbi:hypothetical protein SAMN02745172_01343 [Pseudoxanthobacter soli DSM 19599]|uniref:Uncharacterized protein n=1 Tax=Pseudoxanthobacter soli DSM 19599 TaxID=1123029 RepID=A0A1M7ZEK1_9HYPH|nr:hypothetical protein SAMN02745172_01343 [Pseudoxanthobacter soli DSM 19599]
MTCQRHGKLRKGVRGRLDGSSVQPARGRAGSLLPYALHCVLLLVGSAGFSPAFSGFERDAVAARPTLRDRQPAAAVVYPSSGESRHVLAVAATGGLATPDVIPAPDRYPVEEELSAILEMTPADRNVVSELPSGSRLSVVASSFFVGAGGPDCRRFSYVYEGVGGVTAAVEGERCRYSAGVWFASRSDRLLNPTDAESEGAAADMPAEPSFRPVGAAGLVQPDPGWGDAVPPAGPVVGTQSGPAAPPAPESDATPPPPGGDSRGKGGGEVTAVDVPSEPASPSRAASGSGLPRRIILPFAVDPRGGGQMRAEMLRLLRSLMYLPAAPPNPSPRSIEDAIAAFASDEHFNLPVADAILIERLRAAASRVNAAPRCATAPSPDALPLCIGPR